MALLKDIHLGDSVLAGTDLLLATRFADAGSVGTGETDLYSESVAGTVFAANGDTVITQYALVAGGLATATKRIRAYFAATLIYDSGALSFGANADIGLTVIVERESATVVRCIASLQTTGASGATYTQYTRITGLTLTGANVQKITGQSGGTGSADNDVLAKLEVMARLSGTVLADAGVEALQTPTLVNSWASYGGAYAPVRYWKDRSVVHLHGLIKDGSSATATMFTLPAGYRPAETQIFCQIGSDGGSGFVLVFLSIDSSGVVAASNGTTTWINLSGISFRVA